jgi:4-amino-4-deoxy-L-arabinose transferase-like glycosyltransferase
VPAFVDAFLILSVLSLGIIAVLYRIDAEIELWAIVGMGFVARVGFVAVDAVAQIFGLIGDSPGYEAATWFVAQQWRSGVVFAPLTVGAGPGFDSYFVIPYTTIMSPIYAIFGRSPVLLRLAMAFAGTLIVINVYRITRVLYDRDAGIYAAFLTAVFPYWIYLNGILYRDTLVIAFLTWSVYHIVRWQSGTADRRALIYASIGALLALSFRLVNLVAIGAMVGAILHTSYEHTYRRTILSILSIGAAGILMLALFGDKLTLMELAERRAWLARPNPGAYLEDVIYRNPYELIVFLPIGVLHFVFVPFPWHLVGPLAVIAFVQNLVLWYPIALLSIVGFRDIFTTDRGPAMILPLLTFAGAGIVGYGLVEGNVGPAMRHRTQFQFIFVVLAGIALARRIRFTWSEKSGS